MGRLDEHAKRRIVELRRAGLSFRKIKKVLELDDIRVTPQAVYLFLKRKSVEPRSVAAGWDGDQPWPPLQGHEAEPPRLLGTQHPALPAGDPMGSRAPCSAGSQDTKEDIHIFGVASLCKDGVWLGDTLPMGLAPGNGDDSSTGTALAPGTPLGGLAPLPLPSRGQLIATPTQNSAVTVKKKTVDRAILLQKKWKVCLGSQRPSSNGQSHCNLFPQCEQMPTWQKKRCQIDTCTYLNLPNSVMWVTSVCQSCRACKPLGLTPAGKGAASPWQSAEELTMSQASVIIK
ncbi:PREDICTED: uncharacterized protein LOC106861675 isoform X2 [Sturnus vulgaris]|uniref:uncharacterized protein LOC106861675 isoform X2 n=1 Tax=Sturnus vulgaris TaxID=9172 RepID=UPI00071A4CC6|nr:PREDICTED: uncharacterized protein LOC106861675 isoform X2 [Sturnus vulgaris]